MANDSDDSGESKSTTDHETIRNWAEERGGQPATVENTMEGDEPGVLRIDFDDQEGMRESLERISWDEFFDAFEENDLKMQYQDEVESEETSRFYRFVSRD